MMNKTRHGRSALLALVLLCLSLIVFPSSQASAAPGRASCIIDEVRVLSLADVKLLQPKLTAIEDAHHIRILAVTVKDWKADRSNPSHDRYSAATLPPAAKTVPFSSSSPRRTKPTALALTKKSAHASLTRESNTSKKTSYPPTTSSDTQTHSRCLPPVSTRC